MNCFSIGRRCLALIFVTQKLCHCLLAHLLNLVIKSNPLKYILSQPASSDRVMHFSSSLIPVLRSVLLHSIATQCFQQNTTFF